MPRDFDDERDQRIAERHARWSEEDRDRSFVLGGEVFEYRDRVPARVIDLIASAADAKTDTAYFRRILDAFPELLDMGDESAATLERWEKAKQLVEFADVEASVYWILGEIGRRPTQAPSPSGERRETTGPDSTESFSSPPAVSAASTA